MIGQYNPKNKKDEFMTKYLLPYLMKRIKNDSDDVVKMITSMNIFPYRTVDGIKIGSLNDTDVDWYFDKNRNNELMSSESYRIFAEEVFDPKDIDEIRYTLYSKGYMDQFTNDVVIKSIVRKMSKERSYSRTWWTCAYDVYKMWSPEISIRNLSEATKNIQSNDFLFVNNVYGNSLKKQLIDQGVLKDVLSKEAKQYFSDRIQTEETKDPIDFLRQIGIPCRFVDNQGEINQHILNAVSRINKTLCFPVKADDEGYQQCELLHELLLKIYKELKHTNSDIDQFVVKNIQGSYVPLSWHLFYSEEDYNASSELDERLTDYELEYLHIDVTLYDRLFISSHVHIHKFSEVRDIADSYDIKKTVDFYKLVWHYSQHGALAKIIMEHFTGSPVSGRNTVQNKYREFILSVIKETDIEDNHYCFQLDFNESEDVFSIAGYINICSEKFKNINIVYKYYHGGMKLDTKDYKEIILDAVQDSYGKRAQIEGEWFWNHVYLVNSDLIDHRSTFKELTSNKSNNKSKKFDTHNNSNSAFEFMLNDYYDYLKESALNDSYNEPYIICKIYNGWIYEDVLLLKQSDDEDSYVEALSQYIHDKYKVEINVLDQVDWHTEYNNLIKGITDSLSIKVDIRPTDDRVIITSMDDVKTYGEEKHVWELLNKDKQRIITHRTSTEPINLSKYNQRHFLYDKYRGQCQLCGNRTITGRQMESFFTHRIVKESENALANVDYNMFCLCPSCWGQLNRGRYMGQNMSDLINRALKYADYYHRQSKEGYMNDSFSSLVAEVYDENRSFTFKEKRRLKDLIKPIVCDVVVNGQKRLMTFSWEHFIKIAFALSEYKKIK